jgi:hypothetical protein
MVTNRPVKKSAVSGSIAPRWPKQRVVTWLTAGATLAITGLWWPDWLGAYGHGAVPYIPPLISPQPPLLTYVGATVLLVACYQGIKGMGSHFRGVMIAGALSLASATASIVWQMLGIDVLSLLSTGLAAVFASIFLWFTIGKVADIAQETRTRVAWLAIAGFTLASAIAYLSGLYLFMGGATENGLLVMRGGIVLLTVNYSICAYGIYCYKTQTSIGAGFSIEPDRQFWVSASGK